MSNFEILKGALYSYVSKYRRLSGSLQFPPPLRGSTILVPTIEFSKFNCHVLFVKARNTQRFAFQILALLVSLKSKYYHVHCCFLHESLH